MNLVDRISNLPVDILHHILSFLPTKISAQTSVLSKRWRPLWAHVPILDFNVNDFEAETFSRAVCWAMLLHEERNLATFRLRWRSDQDVAYDLNMWINMATKRNVQNLALFINQDMTLPLGIFKSQSFVDLTLHSCTGIPYPDKT
ncbi:F-box/FBD/LRR-repeat protein at4g00160 [Phtheirospermum japonicum]|uniref:F-box/FBD/LRR-repeat protein at4g00160 n=1 Tax=Phtheirospermum japonicum TaxID=374723 RepID=A0A830CT28_9LAMI|nr:F-box/FBD/LRR-repeat protein at4g00160 [Phtheirospermum japonicum]